MLFNMIPLRLKQELDCLEGKKIASTTQKLSFFTLPHELPREIIHNILQHWMAPECLMIECEDPDSYPSPKLSSAPIPTLRSCALNTLHVTYACATDSAANSSKTLPSDLKIEYWRTRQLSWLRTRKAFRDPFDFYMSHYLLSLDPRAVLPLFDAIPHSLSQSYNSIAVTVQPLLRLPHAYLPQHGLERLALDFDASQYFAFFNVHLPPFDIDDPSSRGYERHHDYYLHGAASLLQHTKHLVLHFAQSYKWAHPWFDVKGGAWADARCRPRVCESGLIVDWILEYAWDGVFVQHLEGFEVRGDVQAWVERKWERIFAKQYEYAEARRRCGDLEIDPFAVHRPSLEATERYGMRDGEEEEWKAEEHYPPECKCEIGCWRLEGGDVLEDPGESAWDEGDEGLRGDWDV